jgi:hypothetical protein
MRSQVSVDEQQLEQPHSVWPVPQIETQLPPTHVKPQPHVCGHGMGTQVAPWHISPEGQLVHLFPHALFMPQAMPAHELLQQAPFTHSRPLGQTLQTLPQPSGLPHELGPQLGVVHTPLTTHCPGAQQMPLTHASPLAQPQLPHAWPAVAAAQQASLTQFCVGSAHGVGQGRPQPSSSPQCLPAQLGAQQLPLPSQTLPATQPQAPAHGWPFAIGVQHMFETQRNPALHSQVPGRLQAPPTSAGVQQPPL